MKYLLTFAIAISFLGLGFVQPVRADDSVQFIPNSTDVNNVGGCDGAAADSPVCQDIQSTGNPLFGPDGILTFVSTVFAVITGVISVFMMMIGGLRYINSGGDPQKTASAKNTILYAGIGVIVASLGGVILRFILSEL